MVILIVISIATRELFSRRATFFSGLHPSARLRTYAFVPTHLRHRKLRVNTMQAFLFATEAEASGGHDETVFLLMLCILLGAALLGNFVERFKQPAVIGSILSGIGVAALLYYTEWGVLQDMLTNDFVKEFSEIGAILLLLATGLENSKADLLKVGGRGMSVAFIGAVMPMVAGTWLLGPILFPDASNEALLFLGAAMVATSVGITIKIFEAVGLKRERNEYKTTLSAAVGDDVEGLVVLAVISDIAMGGDVTFQSVGVIVLKAIGFLIIGLVIGNRLASVFSRVFSKLNPSVGNKMLFAVIFAFGGAYLGSKAGLAPIIGAFTAGLVLDKAVFSGFIPHEEEELLEQLGELDKTMQRDSSEYRTVKLSAHQGSQTALAFVVDELHEEYEHKHVEDLIQRLRLLFEPVFFVYTGFLVDWGSLLKPSLYPAALLLSVVAVLTKMVAGIAMPKGQRLLVGASMVPRGEVGLIFAATGKALGVLDGELFSTVLIVVVFTTLVSPFLIRWAASKSSTPLTV